MSRNSTFWATEDGIWIQWFGNPLRYLATATETDGKYCASIGIVKPGEGASPHCHNFDEGFYILEGTVEFTASNEKIVLKAGDFINVGAGTVHYPRGAYSGPSKMLVIAAPAGFDDFQIRVGGRIADPSSIGTKTEDEMHQRVAEVAGEYGINMTPTYEATNAIPNFHVTRWNEGKTIDVVGDRYRFLAEAEQTGGAYAIWHATIAPGGGPPFHVHSREEEGFFILSGELEFEVDGTKLKGNKGSFANMPIGSRHRFHNASNDPAEMLIMIAPGGLEQYFQRVGSAIDDRSLPITKPNEEEKLKLLKFANSYGIEIG